MLALAGEASSSDPPRAIAVAIAVRIMRILIVFTSPDGAGAGACTGPRHSLAGHLVHGPPAGGAVPGLCLVRPGRDVLLGDDPA